MNSIDLFIIVFSSYFLIRGIFRGFIFELAALIGLAAGYLVATSYSGLAGAAIMRFLPDIPPAIIEIAGFALVFIGVNLGVKLIAGGITRGLKIAMLGWLNRLLGAGFGLIKGLLILSIAVLIINLIPFSDVYLEKAGKAHSQIYPLLEAIGPKLYQYISQHIDKFIS